MTDLTHAQINRGALVAAFLDITLEQWLNELRRLPDAEIPDELNDPLVMAIEALKEAAAEDQSSGSRGDYLQALASLSDDALKWVVKTFGTMPELT